MPELPVKEIRRPELHLPEIDRDQIMSALSGLHIPTRTVAPVERPRYRRFDPRAIDWRAIDLGPVAAGAGAVVRLGSRARPLVRTRWAVAAGVVVMAGLATAALIATPAVRERAGRTVRGVRARVDGASTGEGLEIEGEPGAAEDADVMAAETRDQSVEPMAVVEAADEGVTSPT
jgi:hypothetical protein